MRLLMVLILCSLCLVLPGQSYADAQQQYTEQLQQAAAGHSAQAAESLRRLASGLLPDDPWRARMLTAAGLLEMRTQRQSHLPEMAVPTLQQQLAARFIARHPLPETRATWLVATFAVLLPGGGHALLGRWHDVGVVAMLVWPMLGLTLWAARRRMGPVTVFFGLITLWLWSGSVYSAISLHERNMLEQYFSWWQGVWQAAGLPGEPW